MSDGLDSDESVAKAFVSIIVIVVLLADPLPGDVVFAPPIISAIWGIEEEGA